MNEQYLEFRAICQDVRDHLTSIGLPALDKDGLPLPLTALVQVFLDGFPGQKAPPIVRRAVAMRNTLLLKNMGLVGLVAHRHRNQHVAHEDLQQAGVMGLIRALDEYDPSRAKFSTFAILWVRAEIQRALRSGGKTDVSGYSKDDRAATATYARTGHMPTAKDMGLPGKLDHERVHKVAVSLSEAQFSPWARRSSPKKGDADTTLGDMLVYEDQKTAEEEMFEVEALRVAVDALDKVLTPEEEDLIRSSILGEETARDVARRKKIPLGSLTKMRDRALAKLSKALKPALR